MQRVFTTTIGRDPASMPNENKRVLTFTKGAKRRASRLAGIATRKRVWSITEVKVLPVDGMEVYPIEMLQGEELVVTVSANRCVTVLVSERSDFKEWCEEEAEEFEEDEEYILSYPPCYVSKEVHAATTLKFYATHSETFLVCVINITSQKTRARIEVVHWSRGEEQEPRQAED